MSLSARRPLEETLTSSPSSSSMAVGQRVTEEMSYWKSPQEDRGCGFCLLFNLAEAVAQVMHGIVFGIYSLFLLLINPNFYLLIKLMGNSAEGEKTEMIEEKIEKDTT